MTLDTTMDADWRKAAAAAGQTNEDIEKAFLDAAYAAVSNRATPIMRAPYRVGFEIVFKNDDNTRIVGVFVFRVGKELYYAPVFFLNGSIKGTELFYRVNPKRFVPMTHEWVEYLISLSETSEGAGIPISERSKARNQLNLYQIVDPPNSQSSRKFASAPLTMDAEETHKHVAEFVEQADALVKAAICGIVSIKTQEKADEIRKKKTKSESETAALSAWDNFYGPGGQFASKESSILRKFIVEDGGRSAMAKLAAACEADPEFAQALYLGSAPENYMPEIPEQEKQAGSPDLLVLHTGLLYNKGIKSASCSPEELARGYKFDDFRKESDVNKVVFTQATQELTSPDQPGIYKVMLNSGEMHEMLCAYYHDIDVAYDGCCPKAVCDSVGYSSRGESQQLCLVDLTTRASEDFRSAYKKPMCQFVRTLDPDKSDRTEGGDIGDAKPKSGKAYRIFNTKTQTLSDPFYVVSTKDSDGITKCKVSGGYRLSDVQEIVINPDYHGMDEKQKVFGSCCRFVEVATKKVTDNGPCGGRELQFDHELNLGDQHALNRMIFESGFKQASVKKRNAAWLVQLDGRWHGEFTKLAATAFLMTRCDLTEAAADKLVAEAKGDFYFEPKLTKSGMNIRFNQWPDFYESTNSDYNVLQEPQNQWMIRADADRPIIERNRIGDKYSGGSANQDSTPMNTASPVELYQSSQERGVGKMFEHGVVATLVNTYDSMAMLDKYMPDLEQALDRLGRILFLFYWKPEDFVQAFGSDDQSQLENKLISSFRSYGDLVLELLKKNQSSQQGSAGLV